MTTITKQATWTPELIQEAVSLYIERIESYDEEKRSEVTVEVTAEIAKELGFKLNSVRAQLSKAKRQDGSDVYIRKAKPKTVTTSTAGTGAKRVSKADAQAELTQALKALNAPISSDLEDVISKLTGKGAQALALALNSIED